MSKSKDVDVYLQGELCAKAELATKLLHDIAWSKWTTDAMTARVDPIYKQAREIGYWLLNSDECTPKMRTEVKTMTRKIKVFSLYSHDEIESLNGLLKTHPKAKLTYMTPANGYGSGGALVIADYEDDEEDDEVEVKQ